MKYNSCFQKKNSKKISIKVVFYINKWYSNTMDFSTSQWIFVFLGMNFHPEPHHKRQSKVFS